MNQFDSVKRVAFDTVTHVMGYDATWINTESNGTFTARVGFKDPSEKQELSGIDTWNPSEPFMEYRIDFFPELKRLTDDNVFQYVTIAGIGYFQVKEVQTKVDGETFMARLVAAVPE